MVNKNKSKQCSQKCGNCKGWYEEKDPRTKKALEHQAVARKEKLKDTLSVSMKKEESLDENELTEEIIEEVQNKRKPDAVANDNTKTAKKVGDKKEPEDLVNWVNNPEKTDLKGVDTKREKSKKQEDEGDN